MYKYIFILLLFLTSCVRIPTSVEKTKKKIRKYNTKIEVLARAHNLDSVLYKTKTVELIVPEKRVDTVLVNIEKIVTKVDTVKEVKDNVHYIYVTKYLEPEPIYYSDSTLDLTIKFNKDGVAVNYNVKKYKVKKEIEYKERIINAQEEVFYKTKAFWIFLIILIFIYFILNKRK